MLTLIFLNVPSIVFKVYLGIQFTTKTTGATICFHNTFILPTKVIEAVSHFSPLVTRAIKITKSYEFKINRLNLLFY